MKKFLFNSSITVLLFFIPFGINANTCYADKIICEVKEDKRGGEIFLFKYNNDNQKMGHIWFCSFAARNVSNNDRQFLNQINGQVILEEDPRYNQILTLIDNLNELNYNPLMSVAPQQIINLNSDLFGVLRSFLSK